MLCSAKPRGQDPRARPGFKRDAREGENVVHVTVPMMAPLRPTTMKVCRASPAGQEEKGERRGDVVAR